MASLVQSLIHKVLRDYRIERTQAESIVRKELSSCEELRAIINRAESSKTIARTRAYKDAANRARRTIYYGLRRYKEDDDQYQKLVDKLAAASAGSPESNELINDIIQSHASTRERAADLAEFYAKLWELAGPVETLLDVGCGVQPLTFPFDSLGGRVRLLVAADKDPAAIAALNAYANLRNDDRLLPIQWDIKSGWETIRHASRIDTFDLALLLKVVPVLTRQAPELLSLVAQTPARRLLVTGSRISMTKRKSIEHRERKMLHDFFNEAGLIPTQAFSVGEEFGWFVERC